MSQLQVNLLFAIVAVLVLMVFVVVWRYWSDKLNMSQEDEALERRMAALNERQANRRRDDEIVRLLRGDEHRTLSGRSDQDQ